MRRKLHLDRYLFHLKWVWDPIKVVLWAFVVHKDWGYKDGFGKYKQTG